MPWCERCARQVEDDDLVTGPPSRPTDTSDNGAAGAPADSGDSPRERCPSCGDVLGEDEEEVHPKAPWHFKVLVVGSVGYLGYRLYQGIGWLIHHA